MVPLFINEKRLQEITFPVFLFFECDKQTLGVSNKTFKKVIFSQNKTLGFLNLMLNAAQLNRGDN